MSFLQYKMGLTVCNCGEDGCLYLTQTVAAGDPKRLLQRSRRGVSRRAGGGGSLDPYKVLDIPRNSSKAEVRAAYLEQMKLYHPDISLDEDSAEIAVQLNAAC